MSRVVGALALCVFLAASLSAQSITGSITGVVTDSSGAVIPGAEITVINLGTNVRFTAKSDPGGNYTAPLCLAAATVWKSPPAASNDSSRKASFFRTANRPRRCSVGRRRSGRLRHRDRGRREARDGERHAGESRRQPTITNMPLNTRNVYSLVFLTPGVTGTVGASYGEMRYSVNGARARTMGTMIDGVSAAHPTVNGFNGIPVFPSVDAIEEFKLLGADYPAEFGAASEACSTSSSSPVPTSGTS